MILKRLFLAFRFRLNKVGQAVLKSVIKHARRLLIEAADEASGFLGKQLLGARASIFA